MQEFTDLRTAANLLKRGGIIAYPTEAVFGLGCDPLNEKAVSKILHLKDRPINQGLILVASQWSQLAQFCQLPVQARLNEIFQTWPGPFTWVFKASANCPNWLLGPDQSIAVRISAHPMVQQLCEIYQGAIVSTSANLKGLPPAKTVAEVKAYFPDQIDFMVDGEIGKMVKPSQIIDARSGRIVRS